LNLVRATRATRCVSILVFVVSSMLAMGMSQRLAHVIAPLRRPLPLVLALVVNFALSPLLALALNRIIPAAAGADAGCRLELTAGTAATVSRGSARGVTGHSRGPLWL
jgi:predicted Na+-dependent transporter